MGEGIKRYEWLVGWKVKRMQRVAALCATEAIEPTAIGQKPNDLLVPLGKTAVISPGHNDLCRSGSRFDNELVVLLSNRFIQRPQLNWLLRPHSKKIDYFQFAKTPGGGE